MKQHLFAAVLALTAAIILSAPSGSGGERRGRIFFSKLHGLLNGDGRAVRIKIHNPFHSSKGSIVGGAGEEGAVELQTICPGEFQQVDASCFLTVTGSTLSRDEAQTECLSRNSTLAVVESIAENNFLMDTSSASNSLFLGLGDTSIDSAWAAGTVKDDPANPCPFIDISTGLWGMNDCSTADGYVCKIAM